LTSWKLLASTEKTVLCGLTGNGFQRQFKIHQNKMIQFLPFVSSYL